TIRAILPIVDVAFGTEEEFRAAMLDDAAAVVITHQQVSAPTIAGDAEASVAAMLASPGPEALVVKRGPAGATIHERNGSVASAPGFPVEVTNVLGAGDAFAAGFIYGRTQGWDFYRSARLGNACGAIVVTRHGCANFMATLPEALALAERHGGLG